MAMACIGARFTKLDGAESLAGAMAEIGRRLLVAKVQAVNRLLSRFIFVTDKQL